MYIRTKDGVYVLSEAYWAGNKDEILNQSENLVELCDEFVLIERNAKPIIFKTLQGAINNKIYDDETIYGCIWTFKGLIYVAKTNENGELELI